LKPMEYKTVNDWTICNVVVAGKEGHELFHKQKFIGRYESYGEAVNEYKRLTGGKK
jgi:hypothetical protein